jgi:hypothetical protein
MKITNKQALLAAGILSWSSLWMFDNYLASKQRIAEQVRTRPIQFLVLQGLLERSWGISPEDTAVVFREYKEILGDTVIQRNLDSLAEAILRINKADVSQREKEIKTNNIYFERYNDAVVDYFYNHPESTIILSDILSRYDEFHRFIETIGKSKETLRNFYLRECTKQLKDFKKEMPKKNIRPRYQQDNPNQQNFALKPLPRARRNLRA